mgnify:CR=1 FL=1
MWNLPKTTGIGFVAVSAGLFGLVLWDASMLHVALGLAVDEATVAIGAMTLSIALTTVGYVIQKLGEVSGAE